MMQIFMNALLLAIAFTWPLECDGVGNMYYEAAKIRDSGAKLAEAMKGVRLASSRQTLQTVYSRPDMTAEQWRYYVIGVCMGVMDKPAPMMPPRVVSKVAV